MAANVNTVHYPPASADATRVITLSPVLARPGPSPRSRRRSTSWGRPRCRPSVAGRSSPALATRRWSSKAGQSRLQYLRYELAHCILNADNIGPRLWFECDRQPANSLKFASLML